MAARGTAVIRIDAIWLAGEPLDMRAGTDTALVRVVKVFGAARPHHAYLFANKSGTRMKVLVYDGLGIWLPAASTAAASSGPRERRLPLWPSTPSSYRRWSLACHGRRWRLITVASR
jgi:transposase